MSTKTHYEYAKKHYRDPAVAAQYESWRFLTPKGQARNRRKLAAVKRALSRAASLGTPVKLGIDLPCGTGRLIPLLVQEKIEFVSSDISFEMMQVARSKLTTEADSRLNLGFVQCDGESLPYKGNCVDAFFCIRFMFHVHREARQAIMREMARVSRRWLIIDFRHKYNFRWLGWRLRQLLGLLPNIEYRFSRSALEQELAEVGLRLVEIFPTHSRWTRWFSDKWVVLIEKKEGTPLDGT